MTEWMWCGGPIADIAFSGSALVTSAGHLTDLHRAAGRAPDWLPDLAEALVGLKVTENGAFEALSHAAAGESCGRAAAKIRMDGFRGLYWVREVLGWNIIPAGSSTAAPIEN